PLENAPAFYFILGSVVLEQVGAGILGFTMTFALTNVWSHGTWITPSHAHLALFGTFGMLGIASAYYVIPILRKATGFDQRLGKLAFWLVFTGMLGIAFGFAIGGTVQIFTYRTLGLDWFGGDVFPAMQFYKLLIPLFGLIFVVGAGLLVFDLLTLGLRTRAAPVPPRARTTGGRWSRTLHGYEAGLWLLGMWIFGAVITLGLLSFNLDSVQAGDPTLPYLLAGVGYPGLLFITLFFVWRFLHSLGARQQVPAPVLPHVQTGLTPAR
ncbi:MAG TPA: cbb3-type cytochrome c oxidase subunit I, partial [Castellaniella sp.]|nr:cbb3-type cytochrome c oxidase subunit I [Castellaniella sp.]